MFARLRVIILELEITEDVDGTHHAPPKPKQPDESDHWDDERQQMLDDYD
jgi:hypothetical protein